MHVRKGLKGLTESFKLNDSVNGRLPPEPCGYHNRQGPAVGGDSCRAFSSMVKSMVTVAIPPRKAVSGKYTRPVRAFSMAAQMAMTAAMNKSASTGPKSRHHLPAMSRAANATVAVAGTPARNWAADACKAAAVRTALHAKAVQCYQAQTQCLPHIGGPGLECGANIGLCALHISSKLPGDGKA
jgi:hypothetical protein